MSPAVPAEGWKILQDLRSSINLKPTLSGGQSFRWKYSTENDEWTGVFKRTVWKLRQKDDALYYKIVASLQSAPPENDQYFESLLRKYFRLEVDLDSLYKGWSEKDNWFKSVASKFYGVRMLAQEPLENLFSFICSSNNNISRISSMVENLCIHYGEEICQNEDITYYGFPMLESLAVNEELELQLRKLGFGYRAKFISKSAVKINELGGENWFNTLIEMPYEDAKKELMKLPGIGPKVADCICLMSLNHLEAIPIDTHVYQIASNNYLPHLKGVKSVTDKIYMEIGNHFRELYGVYPGWAHTVLFCADLKKFEDSESKRISSAQKINKRKKPKK